MSDIETGLKFLPNPENTKTLETFIKHLDKRWTEMDEKLQHRKEHFHNLDAANPPLPKPYSQHPLHFQADNARRVHAELKSRCTENHFIASTTPEKDTPGGRAQAQKQDDILNNGLQLVESRQRLDIQGALTDGQSIYGFALLGWQRAPWVYPSVPDYQETDVLPSDPEEAKRFARRGVKYVETDDSLTSRMMRDRARAGFPFLVDVPYAETCRWIEDFSLCNGLGAVLIKKEVPTYDYLYALMNSGATDRPMLSLDEAADVESYGEDAPGESDPSRNDWGDTVTMYQLWTRDECYECVEHSQFEVMKAFRHYGEQVPFELCAAIEINEADPVLRFEPVLEGIYRIKPFYDYMRSLEMIAAEETALPLFYLQKVGSTGFSSLTEEGKPVLLTRNAAASMQIPDGYELKEFDQRLSPSFQGMVAALDDTMNKSEPPTGLADIGLGTKAWAIRLAQAQASILPSKLITNQARAIQGMLRNMAFIASLPPDEGGIGPIAVFGRTSKGKMDKTQVISIQPEEWISLDIDVKIESTSSGERVTLMQVGLTLLAQGAITMEIYLRDFMGVEDAVQRLADLRATKMTEEWIFPNILKQRVMNFFGKQFTMGPDGEFIDGLGNPVTPQQVLQANGQAPTPRIGPPGPPQGQGPGGPPVGAGVPSPMMSSMPPLQTPGTIPLGVNG